MISENKLEDDDDEDDTDIDGPVAGPSLLSKRLSGGVGSQLSLQLSSSIAGKHEIVCFLYFFSLKTMDNIIKQETHQLVSYYTSHRLQSFYRFYMSFYSSGTDPIGGSKEGSSDTIG